MWAFCLAFSHSTSIDCLRIKYLKSFSGPNWCTNRLSETRLFSWEKLLIFDPDLSLIFIRLTDWLFVDLVALSFCWAFSSWFSRVDVSCYVSCSITDMFAELSIADIFNISVWLFPATVFVLYAYSPDQ